MKTPLRRRTLPVMQAARSVRGSPPAYALLTACASLLLLGACASPREHLYALEPPAGESVPAAAAAGPILWVGPVSLPELVDRPQLVLREGAFGVNVLEQERWAAPLKDALPRLLAAELARRLPRQLVLATGSLPPEGAAAHLRIDVTRFDVERDGRAVVAAHWSYRPADDGARRDGSAEARAAGTGGRGYEGCVDALRRASATLADQIATALSAAPAPP